MIKLTALDGSNPLGFLAALGTLTVLHDRGLDTARLAWREEGTWCPLVYGLDSVEQLVDHVMADLETWGEEPALGLTYPDKSGKKTEQDLKPPPERFASYLNEMRALGGRSAELASAFATDVAVDNNGATKPTSLHFTAGQQRFLTMVHELHDAVQREDIEEALEGPWRYARDLPVMGWDATTARLYALRASDPSKDKKLGVPGADWLAFIGLRLLPVVPRGTSVFTTGVVGRWKTSDFSWPLWTVPLTRPVVASLLQQVRHLGDKTSRHPLRAWGVESVLSSRILRTDQGGYGSFAPSRVVR